MGALLLPALSRLGVKVKLLNTGMARCKLNDLIKKNKIDLLIFDPELKNTLIPDDLPCATEETEDLYHRLSNTDKSNDQILPHIKRGGELSVFTGGTSGKYKEAPRQMSIFQFLPPFFCVVGETAYR